MCKHLNPGSAISSSITLSKLLSLFETQFPYSYLEVMGKLIQKYQNRQKGLLGIR